MPSSLAIIPAAGRGTRMGRPKLLVPVAGKPLILHTLAAWQASNVSGTLVVVRPDDQQLASILQAARVETVIPPAAPPDMKASLVYGLAHIAARYNPAPSDVWLVAPADMPGLSPEIINRLIERAATHAGEILIPAIAGRRGHPVLVPWPLAVEISQIPAGHGLSYLIDRHLPRLISCDDLIATANRAFADIDTPGDLAAFANPNGPPAN